MSLYNVVIHFPEIQSQVMDIDADSSYTDERIKVNEAEHLFAEFEASLSGQLLRKFSLAAKTCSSAVQPLDSLLSTSNLSGPRGSTVAIGRSHHSFSASSLLSDTHAPQIVDSPNVDMPNLSELELTGSTSTTTTPAGASPRRPAGRLPPRITSTSSTSNRRFVDARSRNHYPTSATDVLVSPTQLDVRDSSNFTHFGMVPVSPILPITTESGQSGAPFLADTEVTSPND